MLRALHRHLAEQPQDDPRRQPLVFGDLLHPRADVWLLAHRDRTGAICGYEYAIRTDEQLRAGMVHGSKRGLGLLPEPAGRTGYDVVPHLAEAIGRLAASLNSGTQLVSLAGPTASAEAIAMLRAGLAARHVPADVLPERAGSGPGLEPAP